ncbi:3-oxoacyl-[acyl-carrier-protein] synthase-3 [Streptomyces sp. B4I13]|uniref:3-oxoacyl-ACP synthase III family protein n=1 Tax=Streptomyces sp. B4I13 TaxID=3042271 RepID=UPI0027834F3D|nr:3-oxoacyl-[acyl-carrier-protein] synthase III C-terminal domain-containing protein [Streptomyces sp. B4I13]MDQ0958596.1 3-oxoacyl-[acyl-carrier-protein] synthase-3 [Streptomyces sp. B4I13]
MSFGLTAFGHFLPPAVAVPGTNRGYRFYHRADPAVGVTDLAVAAAENALRESGTDPGEIDLLLLAMADIPEYLYWDAAAAAQSRLGAHRAETIHMSQACGGGVAAFDILAGKFATHPEYRTALLLTAHRVCEQYWDRRRSAAAIASDGAAAAVVRRGHGSCRWLATETLTDGRYADFLRMPAGGTAAPFGDGTGGDARVPPLVERIDSFFGGSARATLEFAELSSRRNREVLTRACERAGIDAGGVAAVIYLHDTANAFADLAAVLGVPLERTNHDLAAQHGHLGCADQLFSLERHVAEGRLRPGDVAALMSMGSGMHWICTLIEI